MNDCEKQRILDMINKNKKCRRTCFGPTGSKGEQGEVGPTGSIGLSETIEIGNTITGDAGSNAVVTDRGGPNHVLDFTIPRGNDGPSKIKNAYLVTYNDGTYPDGLNIKVEERIPIDRIELDVDNLVTLNNVEKTLSFNQVGYYKISYIISSMIKETNNNFNPDTDFISIGLRLLNTDNIYIGSSKWGYKNEYTYVSGQGILVVDDIKNIYELVNIGQKDIYILTPDLNNIKSNSYFTNALVNIVVEYLGK